MNLRKSYDSNLEASRANASESYIDNYIIAISYDLEISLEEFIQLTDFLFVD